MLRIMFTQEEVLCIFLTNVDTIPAYFLFSYFFHPNIKYSFNLNTINWKSVDGVLRIWTRSSRMVGADETTDLGMAVTLLVCILPTQPDRRS